MINDDRIRDFIDSTVFARVRISELIIALVFVKKGINNFLMRICDSGYD